MKHFEIDFVGAALQSLWYGEPNAVSQRNCVCAAGHILP
jgi:hypothetical protein